MKSLFAILSGTLFSFCLAGSMYKFESNLISFEILICLCVIIGVMLTLVVYNIKHRKENYSAEKCVGIISCTGQVVMLCICMWGTGFVVLTGDREEVKKRLEYKIEEHVLDTVTVYNSEKGQCDDTPHITAFNDTIDMNNFPNNWIGLSRDLLKEKFKHNDTLWLESEDSSIRGVYIVKDKMGSKLGKNKKILNSGDLLTRNRKLGKWYNVHVYRLNTR